MDYLSIPNQPQTECKTPESESLELYESPSLKKNIIVCWDFDWSLVNENTDHYVQQKLYSKDKYARILPDLMQKAASEGVTVFTDYQDEYGWPKLFKDFKLDSKSFAAALADLPIFAQNLKILKAINQHSDRNNCGLSTFAINQYILSNANQVLIDVVLDANNLKGTFKNDQIWTNPGWYDQNTGILRVARYHNELKEGTSNGDDSEPMNPHHCDLCDANLCKGMVLNQELLPRHQRRGHCFTNKVIYIGDGGNDFCAVQSLKAGDYAFVRQFEECRGLEAKVEDNKENLRCTVMKWKDGKELLENFKTVIPEMDF